MFAHVLSRPLGLPIAYVLAGLWCVAPGSAEDHDTSKSTYISFQVSGSLATGPVAINNALTVAGNYTDSNEVSHGFVRDAHGTITSFDAPGSIFTFVTGIYSAGVITGYYFANGYHGFVRDPHGTMTSFDVSGSASTNPVGINDFGTTTGYYVAASSEHSFVRDPQGNFTTIDDTQGIITSAHALNRTGEVIGTYLDTHFVGHGFVRDPQGAFATFDPPQSLSTLPFGINAMGTITGYYSTTTTPGGPYHCGIRAM